MPTKKCVKCQSEKITASDDEGNELVMPLEIEPGPDDIYFHCQDCGHEWTESREDEEAE